MVTISGAGTAYPSGTPQFTLWFVLLNIQFSVQCFVDHCLSFQSFFDILFFELRLEIMFLYSYNAIVWSHVFSKYPFNLNVICDMIWCLEFILRRWRFYTRTIGFISILSKSFSIYVFVKHHKKTSSYIHTYIHPTSFANVPPVL